MSVLLTLEHVSKSYREGDRVTPVLEDLSITVGPGEFIGVRGPSGCGKTTLLLIAGGLLEPDNGRVVIDAQEPYNLSAEQRALLRAKAVGFVFQTFHLVPYLSVLDNILTPSLASRRSRSEATQRAHELLDRFGLAHRADHVPSKLSAGERQRTALARALLNQPKLLLADEPTGNLDRNHADTVLSALRSFTESGGVVLLVTHDDNAAGFAERTIQIGNGRLTAP